MLSIKYTTTTLQYKPFNSFIYLDFATEAISLDDKNALRILYPVILDVIKPRATKQCQKLYTNRYCMLAEEL